MREPIHKSFLPDNALGKKRRKWLAFIAKLFLSTGLLVFIARSIDFAVFKEAIVSMSIGLFLLSALMFFPAQLLAAYRWQYLLQQLGQKVAYRSVLRHNLLGQFSALFLPGQISGDVIRVVAISRGNDSKAALALSAAIDKVALLAALAVFAIVGSVLSPKLSPFTQLMASSLGLLILAITVIVVFARCRISYEQLLSLPVLRLLSVPVDIPWLHLPRVSDVPVLSFQTIFKVVSLALALQLISTVGGYMLAPAMHIPLGLFDWAAINAVVAVAQIFPISIGGLGVREGVIVSLFALYGVNVAQATAFSLIGFISFAMLTTVSWFLADILGGQRPLHSRPT